MVIPRFLKAFPLERGLWVMAACFSSLPTRYNTEEAASNDSSHRPLRAAATVNGSPDGCVHCDLGSDLVPAHAGGCLPRSFSSDGRNYYPVARTRSRGNRAPRYRPNRSGNEWGAKDVRHALDLPLRAL